MTGKELAEKNDTLQGKTQHKRRKLAIIRAYIKKRHR